MYNRTEIKDNAFKDMFGDDVKFYWSPQLPKIKFKVDKVEYEVTDLRYLNESAVETLKMILDRIIVNGETNEVEFTVPEGMSEDKVDLI